LLAQKALAQCQAKKHKRSLTLDIAGKNSSKKPCQKAGLLPFNYRKNPANF